MTESLGINLKALHEERFIERNDAGGNRLLRMLLNSSSLETGTQNGSVGRVGSLEVQGLINQARNGNHTAAAALLLLRQADHFLQQNPQEDKLRPRRSLKPMTLFSQAARRKLHASSPAPLRPQPIPKSVASSPILKPPPVGLDVVEREGRFYVQSQRYVQSEDEICSFLQNNIGTQLLYEEILANLYVKGGSKAFLEILRCSAQEPELQSLRDGSAEFLRKIADNILWIADSAKAREFLSEAKQLFPPMQWAIEQIQIDLEQTVKDREKVLPDIDRRIAALEKNLQGQDIESLFIYNSLIDGQPFDGAYYEKAFLLSQLGRRQEAITMVLSAYQRAREKFPERAKNLFEWEIDILGSLMAYEEGLRLCDEAIRQFPHHDGFKKEQAYLLRKQAVPPPSA